MDKFTEEIKKAVVAFNLGKIVLYPTDTIWGIGCIASNETAHNSIFKIKNRPINKQFILLVSNFEMLGNYVELNKIHVELIKNNTEPLTIIYSDLKDCPRHLISEDGEIAIRVVNSVFCKNIINVLGEGIVSTSANVSNEKTALEFDDISKNIKDAVDHCVGTNIVDEGTLKSSRIIRIKDDVVEILRT